MVIIGHPSRRAAGVVGGGRRQTSSVLAEELFGTGTLDIHWHYWHTPRSTVHIRVFSLY